MKFPTVNIALLGAAAAAVPSGASAFVVPSSRSRGAVQPRGAALRAKTRGEGYGPPLENISEAVGNTPMVKISDRICPAGRTIYAKCEFFNPLGSVKDRLALSIIEAAEKDGSLKPGQTVVEATSGNTGIAVAMMCAQRGYPCVITMAEPFSVERRKLMRMLGAKVIVTPKAGKGTVRNGRQGQGAWYACRCSIVVMLVWCSSNSHRINTNFLFLKYTAEKNGWFLCHQFETEANWKFHYDTTGPEILNDLTGTKLDYWVTGYGTGGTFHGAGKYIKENSPDTKVILAEPGAANLIGSGIKTERNGDGSPAASHPAFSPHPIQGWTPDFIPLDEMVEIPDGAAVAMSQSLAKNEGILTGISGGATMWAAVETAKKAPEGSVLVAMLPDTGERYLSTPLFASIAADMNEEELEIARSTPSYILEPVA
ncbi:hypothetical protein ACHAWF_008229 [Thalassiosira exigua]